MALLGKLTYIQSYDADDSAYPILGILCDPRAPGYQVPPDLEPHPDTQAWPNHVFYSSTPIASASDGRVMWSYGIFPGPQVPSTRYDPLLGPIQALRRRVVNTGQTASLTATVKTTYDSQNDALIIYELEETNSNGTGTSTNPAYPILTEDTFEPDRGSIEKRTQVVAATGSEIGSISVGNTLQTLLINAGGSGYVAGEVITLAGGTIVTPAKVRVLTVNNGAILTFTIDERGLYSATIASLTQASTSGSGTGATFQNAAYFVQAREISFQPIDQFKLSKSIEMWTIPGPVLTSEAKIDDDGVTITSTRNLDISTNIVEGEIISAAGVWTITTSEAYSGDTSGAIRRKLTQSRLINAVSSPTAPSVCPILREDRWNDQFNVIQSTFRQYVPENTSKKIIGTEYETADIYVSNSIINLTVGNPGFGYTTIPTLTISASPGGGTLATATVTNLRVVNAVVSAPGSGYVFGDTVTVSGGTSSTAAILTVSGGSLATLAINTSSRGTGYVAGDVVELGGGGTSFGGTITVSTLALVSAAINAAGSGYTSGGTVTLAGGTSATKAIVSISTLKLVGVSINSGGTGYAVGNTVRLDSGTASVKAVVTVATVDGGGAILTIDPIITTPGNYTVTSATHTSTATSGVGTGATFNTALYGILTFAITTAGSYTVGSTTFTQDSATGGGTGATFQTGAFGINTFAIINGGNYLAPAATAFTAASSSGSGTGATFQNATYKINQLTVYTAGAYTVIPASPNAVTTTTGAGTGMTVNLSFGVGAVALGGGGSLYYYPPTITTSYGNAYIVPKMSALIVQAGVLAGFVVDTGLLNTEYSKIKRLVWSTMFTPPTRLEVATKNYPLPNVFSWISDWNLNVPDKFPKGPYSGVNFTNIDNGISVSGASCVISYSLGGEALPDTWQVITPGVASNFFKISSNTIHNSWFVLLSIDGYTDYVEIIQESTPSSYVKGQALIVEVSERKVIGNFYEKRIYTVR